jgi:hypothetical protein
MIDMIQSGRQLCQSTARSKTGEGAATPATFVRHIAQPIAAAVPVPST